MADNLIDKGLDEIVKIRGIGRRRGGGAGGAKRGGAGGQTNGAATRSGGLRRGGGLGRRQQSTGSIQKRRSGGAALNSSLSPNKAAASANGQWNHDLYQNGTARRGVMGSAATGPAKLVISNLDFGVNDSDIEGLFQEFGKIRKAAVHYDRSGRSLGTADVLFERKQDAIRALTHYNGVSLDGRPMKIELTASLSARTAAPVVGAAANNGAPRSGAPRRGGAGGQPRRGAGSGAGTGRGGRGGGGGGRGGKREEKPSKSAADLDAELDAHNAKMQTD